MRGPDESGRPDHLLVLTNTIPQTSRYLEK
jgi:hypothetical protein